MSPAASGAAPAGHPWLPAPGRLCAPVPAGEGREVAEGERAHALLQEEPGAPGESGGTGRGDGKEPGTVPGGGRFWNGGAPGPTVHAPRVAARTPSSGSPWPAVTQLLPALSTPVPSPARAGISAPGVFICPKPAAVELG